MTAVHTGDTVKTGSGAECWVQRVVPRDDRTRYLVIPLGAGRARWTSNVTFVESPSLRRARSQQVAATLSTSPHGRAAHARHAARYLAQAVADGRDDPSRIARVRATLAVLDTLDVEV